MKKQNDDCTMNDPVNHPEHYELSSGIECFDVILSSQGLEAAKGFCVGNAIKYLFRAPRKNGAEDHKKARWYIDKLIELDEEDQERQERAGRLDKFVREIIEEQAHPRWEGTDD